MPTYPATLARDVASLADQLDASSDQPLREWQICLPDGTIHILFELLQDRRIAGCVKSADQRIVNPRPLPGS